MTTTPGPYMNAMSWRESLRLGLRTMLGRAYPRLISAVREREWLFYEVAFWLELIRRALLGDAVARTFPIASTPEVIGLLLLTTALAIVVCLAIFRVSDHVARERGHIDRPTGD